LGNWRRICSDSERRLPQVGGALGKGIRNFKSGLREEAEVAVVIVEESRKVN